MNGGVSRCLWPWSVTHTKILYTHTGLPWPFLTASKLWEGQSVAKHAEDAEEEEEMEEEEEGLLANAVKEEEAEEEEGGGMGLTFCYTDFFCIDIHIYAK